MAQVDLTKDRPSPKQQSGVFFQKWFPGLHVKYPIGAVDAGAKAVVIEGYHSGTLPTARDIQPGYNAQTLLQYIRNKGIPTFMIFGESVTDPDNKFGYQPFDEGKPGGWYESTRPAIALGLVPLRANSPQAEQVCAALDQILSAETDRGTIEDRMYALFPFATPLAQIRSAVLNSE